MFAFDLISDNVDSIECEKRLASGLIISVELLFAYVLIAVLCSTKLIEISDSLCSSMLSALGLYSGTLIAAIIQLNNNVTRLNTEWKSATITYQGESGICRKFELERSLNLAVAKINASKFLFSNLMFGLFESLSAAALFSAYFMLNKNNQFKEIACIWAMFICVHSLFTNYRSLKRIYIFMYSDFPNTQNQTT